MSRPSKLHKSVATDLAKSLPITKENKQAIFDLIEKLGYAKSPKIKDDDNNEDLFKNHIGIYQKEIKNGKVFYHRDIKLKDRWSFFADVQTIPPKSTKKRIVLLGESVTRGFLLDPEYTPSIVLNELLNSKAEEYEVIDLAETNLGMAGLKERYEQCVALNPDLVIFLAGNNWREDLLISIGESDKKQDELQKYINSEKGISTVKPLVEEYFSEIVSTFLASIAKTSKKYKFPVIFAIPEFNLLDCRSTPGERVVSELPISQLKNWLSAKDKAESSLLSGDLKICEEEAQKMTVIDPSHPLGFELLADCKIKKEEFREAIHFLELARDTALFCRTNSKPRTFKIVQQTILEKAKSHNIHVVDLPEIFKTHLKGKVPGRDLFLDYCHLSVEGIQVSVSAIYHEVLKIFNDNREKHMDVTTIVPSNEILALGHLFAAIHNAHWGQSYDILLHHCTESIKSSKEIVKTMVYYCDMISRSAANNVCKSLEKILEANTKLDRYVHALIPARNMKNMELELVDAMTTVLKNNGVDLTDYLVKLRIDEHGIKNREIDLLKSYYHATSYEEYQGTKTAFLQARDIQSRFFMVSENDTVAKLKIGLRIPVNSDKLKSAILSVNDTDIKKMNISNQWNTYNIEIPNKHLKKGINQIKVKWPIVNNKSKNKANDLSNSLLDAAFHVFGEICTMTVTDN